MQPIYPFRWNIAKRSQLGSLIGTPEEDRETWLDWDTYAQSSYRWGTEYTYDGFTRELRHCSARIIAFCDNSDLCFVGRSPDSVFDYLSGLLYDTSWADRLSLLHYSASVLYWGGVEVKENHTALYSLREYLAYLGLDPKQLASRERPVALVDVVSSGQTFGKLVGLIQNWCLELGEDWSAVQRKLRIVGLTERTKTSPNTWRWQQHAEWVSLLEVGSIKNVSLPIWLLNFMGSGQPKMTASYPALRWGDPQVTVPMYDDSTLAALRLALALFDDGRQKAHRTEFARELSKQPAVQHKWFRELMGELNR